MPDDFKEIGHRGGKFKITVSTDKDGSKTSPRRDSQGGRCGKIKDTRVSGRVEGIHRLATT